MKCYYHHAHDTVGLCARCSRALCVACASEVNGVLACRDRCEDDIRQLQENNSMKAQQSEVAGRGAAAGMGTLLGLMLAVPGAYGLWLGWQQHFAFYYVPGGISFGLGLLVLVLIGIFLSQKKSVR